MNHDAFRFRQSLRFYIGCGLLVWALLSSLAYAVGYLILTLSHRTMT